MNVLGTAFDALLGWPLALGAIGTGALGGAVLAWVDTRTGARRLLESGRVDLEARREALYAQLRELDDTADKLDKSLYESERARLLFAAAEVLRALDAADAPAADRTSGV